MAPSRGRPPSFVPAQRWAALSADTLTDPVLCRCHGHRPSSSTEAEAQERADGDDDGENTGADESRVDGDGADDVGAHEDLKPERYDIETGLLARTAQGGKTSVHPRPLEDSGPEHAGRAPKWQSPLLRSRSTAAL